MGDEHGVPNTITADFQAVPDVIQLGEQGIRKDTGTQSSGKGRARALCPLGGGGNTGKQPAQKNVEKRVAKKQGQS